MGRTPITHALMAAAGVPARDAAPHRRPIPSTSPPYNPVSEAASTTTDTGNIFLKGKRADCRDLAVIVVFNQAPFLSEYIRHIRTALPDIDILVVDDGSTDGSRIVALAEGVMVLRHPFRMGAGRAFQSGCRFALKHGYDTMLQLEGSGEREAEQAALLLQILHQEDAALVIGRRPALAFEPSAARSMDLLARKWERAAAHVLTGHRFADPGSRLRAISAKVLPLLCTESFPHDCAEVAAAALIGRAGRRIIEVPPAALPPGGVKAGGHPREPTRRSLDYPLRLLSAVLVINATRRNNVSRTEETREEALPGSFLPTGPVEPALP